MAPRVITTPEEGERKRPQLWGSLPRRSARHRRNSSNAVLTYRKMNCLSSMVRRTCGILRVSVSMRMACRRYAVSLGDWRDRTMVELRSRGQSSFLASFQRLSSRASLCVMGWCLFNSGPCSSGLRLPPCAYMRDCTLFRMRKSVRWPTHFSYPAVGARLKRNTASCLSISAPHSARLRLPELPTTAQLPYMRLPPNRSLLSCGRCFSMSAMYSSHVGSLSKLACAIALVTNMCCGSRSSGRLSGNLRIRMRWWRSAHMARMPSSKV
mmetsp:Transcript_35787/g.92932  ORF Transcript_35787/g.92932 Transcript_35787/m.92932 type:complete len:267 (+) Transcript_35787:441-1241(+)